MAFLSDVALFPRTLRSHKDSTSKKRPLMKLEWNKLLAEATEKDTKLANEFVGRDDCYDDEDFYEMEGEYETEDEKFTGELEKDRPLNLSHKSKTMPNLCDQFHTKSLDVVDLSSVKKAVEMKVSWMSNDIVKQSPCTVPNLQFTSVSLAHGTNGKAKVSKNEMEPIIENKENIPSNNINNNNNNVRNICSTPCNSKFIHSGKIGRQSEDIDGKKRSSENDGFHLKPSVQSLIFYSEKKPAPSSINEKTKSESEESNKKNKLDLIAKKDQNSQDVKKSCISNDTSSNNDMNAQPPIKLHPSTDKEQFAVPTARAKYNYSSRVLTVNNKSYKVLALIGKGGSSKVFLVLNAEHKFLAIKVVKLSGVSVVTKNGYLNEIQHLQKLQHTNHVVKLYDHEYLTTHKILLVVMEKGDTDLSQLLKQKTPSDGGISPELIMYYWTEMLLVVKCIHDNNIIHRDLKPANFLLVSGKLKLIDFGIASSIQTEQTSVLMESQSGTFNYMSPEALQDLGFENKVVLKIGRKTDVWSLGCILYSFLYHKTPYQDVVKPIQKMKAITDPNYVVPFPKIPGVPDILIESCKRCLVHDPKKRASVEELLEFRSRPLFTLNQVFCKLEKILPPEEYEKAVKAFEEDEKNSS